MKLKSGDTVRVVGERVSAKVRAILTAVHGALLQTQISGFRSWNIDDLRLVKREKAAKGKQRNPMTVDDLRGHKYVKIA
jgi:hypothetical protein